MAIATLPSPLYGLYRTRDHLSALTITVVFAIFAGSTIAMLQRDSFIAARIGRRGTMLGAVATPRSGQIASSASDLVTTRPRAPSSCRSPNTSRRMDWSRPPTRTGS
jgi:hypothetical protein